MGDLKIYKLQFVFYLLFLFKQGEIPHTKTMILRNITFTKGTSGVRDIFQKCFYMLCGDMIYGSCETTNSCAFAITSVFASCIQPCPFAR